MYFTVVLLINFFIFATDQNTLGYYWRDFTGAIPEDALPGGTDANCKTIYIGQIYDTYLIPAQIYENDKTAYYEYGGEEKKTTKNIKILCTQTPKRFSWIATDNDHINSITDNYLVIGGYEPGCTTYIGRATVNNEVLIGKALTDNHAVNAGLHVTQNGVKYKKNAFEVLSYNSRYLIDVRRLH